MVSINKDNQQAITDVSSFISRQWQEESNSYINIDFDSINKTEYKINCLSEQQYVCCYCSREIENTPQTELEHIIPKSINTIDSLQQYLDLSPILLTHIARQPDGKRAYTRLSGFRSFCLCTTDFILVKGRCLMPRVSNNCFNFCSGREHFFTDISCSALL